MLTDEELRSKIQSADEAFKSLIPLLKEIGEGLVAKVKRETGYETDYSLGWAEAGIETICLNKKSDDSCFQYHDEAFAYQKNNLMPLFEGKKIVGFTVFSLFKEFRTRTK